MKLNEISLISLDPKIHNTSAFAHEFKQKNMQKNSKSYTNLGNLGNYNVVLFKNDGYEKVAVVNSKNKKVLLYVRFQKKANAHQTTYLVTNNSMRGSGLSAILYAWLILKHNWIIMSDVEQSLGGLSVWKQLFTKPGILVYGWNLRKKQAFQIDLDDFEYGDEVYANKFDDDYQQDDESKINNDIVLIATRK